MLSLFVIASYLLVHAFESTPPFTYTCRTYVFYGNTFVEQYNSKLDTAHYTWRDSVVDGRLHLRAWPGSAKGDGTTETYFYDEKNRLVKIRKASKSLEYSELLMDSTVYTYKNDRLYSELEYITYGGTWKKI